MKEKMKNLWATVKYFNRELIGHGIAYTIISFVLWVSFGSLGTEAGIHLMVNHSPLVAYSALGLWYGVWLFLLGGISFRAFQDLQYMTSHYLELGKK